MKVFTSMKSLAIAAGILLAGTQAIEAKPAKPSGGSSSGNVVISKVFYSGSTRLNGATPKNYMLHLYVQLYNNSADTLDVAGMYVAFANSDGGDNAWTAAAMAEAHKDSAVVKQIFRIPAETERLLNPGESIVITNSAIDHSTIAEGGVDLSQADYEVKSANKAYADSHNAAVPELQLVSSFATTDFINMLNPGPDGIILLAADTKIDKCPKTFAKGKTSGSEYTIVPLFKSIDCVDIVKQKAPTADDKRFASNYDAGFCCTESPETFSGQAVVRKTAFVTGDGRTVLFDTNNSSVDFESTSDLSLRTYGKLAKGLRDTTIVVPESGYLPFVATAPFCGPKDMVFCYVNASGKSEELKYNETPGDSLLLMKGDWIAIAQPGTYTLKLSESQGVMKTRTSSQQWSDEAHKELGGSQKTRIIYTFQNVKGNMGFKRVPKTADGDYNVADFANDDNRLFVSLTPAIVENIATKMGVQDLDFIPWTGSQPIMAYDTEVASVAAFNAVENGKTVKLNLNGVRVNAYNSLLYLAYIEDETGVAAINVKKTNIALANGDVLSGYLIGTKEVSDLDFMGTYPNMKQHILNKNDYTSAYSLSATAAEPIFVEATVAEAAKEGSHGRLFTISNVEIKKDGRRFFAYSGEDKICVNDELGVLPEDYEYPAKALSISGVVTYDGVRWQISPLTADGIVADGDTEGISTATVKTQGAEGIYNMQGMRLREMQRGLNIVAGKKVLR